MYFLEKTITISGAHKLKLDYDSPCQKVHGHNWKITVYCRSSVLDHNGMVLDFSVIGSLVKQLDHRDIGEVINQGEVIHQNPTAEHIARWICIRLPDCYRVRVEETEGNTAIYER